MEINQDLISRSALRSEMYHEAFEKDSDEQRWDSGCWIRFKLFERVVDGQPPAQPERKKAVWRHEPRKKSWIFYCSACGAKAYWPQSNRKETQARCKYKICPNCEAEMEASE